MICNHQQYRERCASSSAAAGMIPLLSFAHRVGGFCAMVSLLVLAADTPTTNAWIQQLPFSPSSSSLINPILSFKEQIAHPHYHRHQHSRLQQQSATNIEEQSEKTEEEVVYDYEIPEDAVIHIKPSAMRRLRELRDQRQRESSSNNSNETDEDDFLILRMGVRSGGCSGMSYVMDFCTKDSINVEDDQIDIYINDKIQCVVDSKSMLYLYGLQLDYSTQLIGGGFKFYNPNAEESCGCGSSFGV